MTTTAEWVSAYAAAAGVSPPSQDDIDVLLQLAGVAAHASERTAAPITCWIAATAGLDPRPCARARRVGGGSRDLTRRRRSGRRPPRSSRPRSSPSTANGLSVVQVPALRRLKAVTADRISALGLPWSG